MLGPFFRLARGNPQRKGILDLSKEPEISRSNFYGFESAIYVLIKELADSDDYKILGLKSGKIATPQLFHTTAFKLPHCIINQLILLTIISLILIFTG